MKIPGVTTQIAEVLWEHGIISLDEIHRMSLEELMQVKGVNEELVRNMKEYAKNEIDRECYKC
ncbi:MAG: helix-hairpin-helix domain-containing protein [Candidatus Altiarchaeota archaeon]